MSDVYTAFGELYANFGSIQQPEIEYAAPVPGNKQDDSLLKRFLDARMDATRLKRATGLARHILKYHDSQAAEHFWSGVQAREVTGDIAYDKQRDHSAHTVNNYLFGLWIFKHSARFRRAFKDTAAKRYGGKKALVTHAKQQLERRKVTYPTEDDAVRYEFERVWFWASLLHDIGYLLEGGMPALSVRDQDDRIARGARHIEGYNTIFWQRRNVRSPKVRRAVGVALGMRPVRLDGGILQIGEAMQDLGNTTVLAKALKMDALPDDAFNLWIRHYNRFDSKNMRRILAFTRSAFTTLMSQGLPGAGVRMLDHGVVSGLIQLKFSTAHFQVENALQAMRRALDKATERKRKAAIQGAGLRVECVDLLKDFTSEDLKTRFSERPDQFDVKNWWRRAVWGTAAAAVHNVLQMGEGDRLKLVRAWEPLCPDHKKWRKSLLAGKKEMGVTVDQDPIAFLGILVDSLQVWDRYPVDRITRLHRWAEEPHQGDEVGLAPGGGSSACPTMTVSLMDFRKSTGSRATRIRRGVGISTVRPAHA